MFTTYAAAQTILSIIHTQYLETADAAQHSIMHENSTVNCPKCGTEVPITLDLCPQCGIEIDPASLTKNEPSQEQPQEVQRLERENPPKTNTPARQSEEDGTRIDESSTPDRVTSDSTAKSYDDTTGRVGGRTVLRFGFAAVAGVVGGVFLLAPLFLVGPDAFRLLFGGGKKGIPMAPYGAGLAVATVVTMAGGSLCLFAAALRLAGVRFDISRVAGVLGILGGGIGIIMIFVTV